MIEPIQGNYYKIKYIGGSLYTNYVYETYASFIRKSIEKNRYICPLCNRESDNEDTILKCLYNCISKCEHEETEYEMK